MFTAVPKNGDEKNIFFINVYIIINTDSIFKLVHVLNNLKQHISVAFIIMFLYALIVEICDMKLKIGF